MELALGRVRHHFLTNSKQTNIILIFFIFFYSTNPISPLMYIYRAKTFLQKKINNLAHTTSYCFKYTTAKSVSKILQGIVWAQPPSLHHLKGWRQSFTKVFVTTSLYHPGSESVTWHSPNTHFNKSANETNQYSIVSFFIPDLKNVGKQFWLRNKMPNIIFHLVKYTDWFLKVFWWAFWRKSPLLQTQSHIFNKHGIHPDW